MPSKKTANPARKSVRPARALDKRRANEFANELALAKKAARAAGEILRRHWHKGGYQIGSKGHDNPVTQADLEADRALKKILHEPFPDYGWLSEETADNDARLACRRVWIVDPLDGTKEFIKGIPEFCVAIALVEDGAPVLGVTYNPIRREMFWAARGIGCHLGTRRVRVTRTRALARARILASRSETGRGEWEAFAGKLNAIPMGSVAYKLALVAGGKADATFTRSPKSEWDVASGTALIVEAGGTVTDIRGHPVRFNRKHVKLEGFIADNTALHRELTRLAVIRKSRTA
jgi:myo-inositol-1(or 4)-monophosphatase